MTPDDLLQGIDYALLRKQKAALLASIWDDASNPAWGIIGLLDSLQDCAEEAGYMPELPCGEFKADFDFDHSKCANCGFTEDEHSLTITPEP